MNVTTDDIDAATSVAGEVWRAGIGTTAEDAVKTIRVLAGLHGRMSELMDALEFIVEANDGVAVHETIFLAASSAAAWLEISEDSAVAMLPEVRGRIPTDWHERLNRENAVAKKFLRSISPPVAPDPFAELRDALRKEPLGGVRRQVVDAILDAGGSISINALIDRIPTWDDEQPWKSAARDLRPKLNSHGWTIRQVDGAAVIFRLPAE